ncbi:MAG: chemotaxis protein [Thermodesulfovibrio sp.]|nr:chemotaxis protein [Thermodesulfovibrio sp.]
MSFVLKDPTFREFRDFIYEKCGIFIPDTKKYLLENRLVKRIEEKGLSGFEDYLKFIKYSTNGDELSRLFDAITTNETYFFREPQQLDVFADQIAPKVLGAKKTKDIRIWSAACSTGEEAYTLIMMLAEKQAGVRTEIVGSDISDEVIASAKRAVYNSYSIRNVPEPYMKKYFKNNGQMNFELDAAAKRPVSFSNVNLIDEKKIKTLGSFDVIFCRNVLIYFDDKAKQKVVSHLYNSLKPGGYLFVGSSESLHSVTRAFRPVIINKVVVYQRG